MIGWLIPRLHGESRQTAERRPFLVPLLTPLGNTNPVLAPSWSINQLLNFYLLKYHSNQDQRSPHKVTQKTHVGNSWMADQLHFHQLAELWDKGAYRLPLPSRSTLRKVGDSISDWIFLLFSGNIHHIHCQFLLLNAFHWICQLLSKWNRFLKEFPSLKSA